MKANEYTKAKANPFAITRDLREFDKDTGNIYQTVAILSKRANQIATELKEDFQDRVKDFTTHYVNNDVFEENMENKEQVELARFYEHLPKPVTMAIHEFENNEIFYKTPQ
ncbi:MAG: DNA-directed RNA polymerase subunit omega [Bacteroidetes bacterium]|nr:DNA-directed RNA polymerase subunit omega [Bacteroidota bacterium]MCL1967951.1 DNA-directed RNA polymerase subunit omega [Bacteroidota bacterium]